MKRRPDPRDLLSWNASMKPGANPDLEQTLDRHGSFVMRLAKSLVFDENRADDLTQQAWLAAAQHPPRDATKARGWLARVLRNFSFRMHREDVRRSEREHRVAKPEAAAPPCSAPPEAAMLREVIDAVVRLD